nr:pentapeptide repeat-containing protein [Baaleninema simplex]
MNDVNLFIVDLFHGSIFNSSLKRANFEGGMLAEVYMDAVNLEGANFRGCELAESCFSNCNLTGAFLDEYNATAYLRSYYDLFNTIMPDGSVVSNCK